MRLGGGLTRDCPDPAAWVAELRRLNHSAAVCPLDERADDATVRAYVAAAAAADVVIAEVGAWSNPLSTDDAERAAAVALCQARLDLADRVGAGCCVNITGSRGPHWAGPFAADLTPDTFDLVVHSVRTIVDAVRPTRTFYALETMPWMVPDSPDAYVRLLAAIDRPRVAAHLDPVNLVNSPARYFDNAALIRECFEKLGSRVKCCHAKDVALGTTLTVHLDEVRPGLGGLDYAAFLRAADRLGPDLPVLLEHLPDEAEYVAAAAHVRSVAADVGVVVK